MQENNNNIDKALLKIAYKYMALIVGLIWPLVLFLKDVNMADRATLVSVFC